MKERIKNILKNRETYYFLILILLVSAIFYFSYSNSVLSPYKNPPGWFGWYDQSQYIQMAKELSSFSLTTFTYGIGYPVIGAIFARFIHTDPFLIPNLLILIGTTILLYLSMKSLVKSSLISFLTSVLFLISTHIVLYVYIPWNSTPNLFFGTLIFYLVVSKKRGYLTAVLLALSLVWIFASRYIDMIFVLPILFVWCWDQWKTPTFYKYVGTFIIASIIFVSPILMLHKIHFGGFLNTPYSAASRAISADGTTAQDFTAYKISTIPENWGGVLFGTNTVDDMTFPSLLTTAPLFFLFPIGVWGVIKSKSKIIWAMFLGMIIAFLFYGSFYAFSGDHIKFYCVHYIKMWFPFLTIIVVLGILELFKSKSEKEKSKLI